MANENREGITYRIHAVFGTNIPQQEVKASRPRGKGVGLEALLTQRLRYNRLPHTQAPYRRRLDIVKAQPPQSGGE